MIRWQNWVNVVLGLWLMLSPSVMGYTLSATATANAHGLGAVLVIFNLLSVNRLQDQGQEILNILLGIWLILSPYALDFTAEKESAINVAVVGITVVLLAVWQIYNATKAGNK